MVFGIQCFPWCTNSPNGSDTVEEACPGLVGSRGEVPIKSEEVGGFLY